MPGNKLNRFKKLPRFTEGDSTYTSFSASTMNPLIDFYNAFVSLQITRGNRDDFILSDANAIIQIAKNSGDGSSGSGLNYRGVYASGSEYSANDLVYVDTDEYERTWWVCETENGPGSVHVPGHPEGSPVYWRSVIPRGIIKYRGLYSASTDYFPNDLVYLGSSPTGRTWWVCETENGPGPLPVVTPTFAEGSPVYWRAMSGGTGMHYEGVYNPSLAYTAGSVVVLRPGGDNYATYVAVEDASSSDHPVWPEPVGAKWIMLGQGYITNIRVCEVDGTITTIPVYGPPP